MNHRQILFAGLAFIALGAADTAFAQTNDSNVLTVGIGAAVIPSYEGSDDYRVIPVPQLRGKVSDFAFWTRGPSLYFDVIPNRGQDIDLQMGPVAGVRFDRSSIKNIKDDAVRALGKRDKAVELGGFVGIGKTGIITSAYDNLSVRVAVTKDVAGAHESFIVTPAIEYFTPLSTRSFVGLGVSADYVGKKYGRYYYDVDAAGALASGLPEYSRAGDGSGFKKVGVNLTGGLSLSGDIRKGWALFALGGYSRMLGDYADSPIVSIAGSKNQWIGAVGVGYTF
ncbi:MipA/OmpV family protein [Sphingobium sp. Cam5-1]|uniref:MipA/OmpV family protein n=1 Tax=Sphingobium sp. Cam5-1 TaxID=2789327 RepID=UPI0018AD2ABE|nr:MipA/OmpV family protein [Sphingobium sp. Cam5-1]QPI73019.1 MipA/OmpV family protein [Sphingobium sp. Cam5-1]